MRTLALDKVDNLDSGLGNVGHVLSVRKLPKEGRSANDDVDTVDTYTFDGHQSSYNKVPLREAH